MPVRLKIGSSSDRAFFRAVGDALLSLAACCLLLPVVLSGSAAAQRLEGTALIEALRQGGYTIYFRHAATDWRQADRVEGPGDWTSCDPSEMRQLSYQGRDTAKHMGEAIRSLDIPVAKVLSSEYCRAAETARLLGLGSVQMTRDLMNMNEAELVGGREAVIERARRILSEPAPPGSNVVIVGHGNLMRAATGAYAGEAGSGIYAPAPASETGVELVAELSPEDWRGLADRFASGRQGN